MKGVPPALFPFLSAKKSSKTRLACVPHRRPPPLINTPATPPLLIVYIFLDSLGPAAHNPASFSLFCFVPGSFGGAAVPLPPPRSCSCEANDYAISAGLDGAVFESRMPCARPLAPRRRHFNRSLQQLRLPPSQRAAAPRPALPHAPAPPGQLPPSRPPALTHPTPIFTPDFSYPAPRADASPFHPRKKKPEPPPSQKRLELPCF
jgi:hypothetical protein